MKEKEEKEEIEETDIETQQALAFGGCIMTVVSILFWWVIISHMIMRFKNPSMTETQLFLNLPRAFVLEEPVWGIKQYEE